ncbi:P-loop containing nucleoside triphosphate hydrolase protein [Infundibulicybe gibba]|nr:P-loop containing nucleoside triphosphate hydrolase protein [Infundibulicybe gibba]
MSFFRGGSNNTPPPYNRVPNDPGLPSGVRPGPRAPPPPSAQYHQPATPYNDPSGAMFAGGRQYDRKVPPRSGGSYGVVSSPSDALALTNCLIVHPSDFQQGQHVLINSGFALTVRHDNTGKLQPGVIGASAMQRQWIGLSISGDQATVEPLHTAPAYLQSIDLEIAEQYSADEMARNFIKAFSGILMSVDEVLIFEFHGQNLKVVIKAVAIVELADEQRKGAAGGPRTVNHQFMGVLMEKTDVTFMKAPDSAIKIKANAKNAPKRYPGTQFKFQDMGIGGLDTEFSEIFRRAFASRVFPPGLVEKLGIEHVKGILLHGPPGTGKTLIARQIGKMLNAREPKVVNGPEILSKYVGASEENIRKLFEDAEKEYKEKKDESGLHIIIFDELDAIFKQRGSTNSGTGVGDSVVNQLLSKMDGVDQLNNILIIGMTNRLDMIDEALLRPGRLEVHMEISLPDEHGRFQILNIHTTKMRTNGVMDHDNFSGAEINGLIKSATSFAFNRHVKVGTMAGISEDVENLRVNRSDFMHALDEVHPAFGVSEEELEQVIQNGIIHFSSVVDELLQSGKLFVEQVRSSTRTPLVSVLFHGPPGTGKTALSVSIAMASEFPFIKLISPDRMVGFSESQKVAAITKVFADSYKSPLSIVVVDNIERLIDWTPMGARFSNSVLQTLLVLLGRRPPKGRRLLIIATSSLRSVLTDLGLSETFDSELYVPPISDLTALKYIVDEVELFPSQNESNQAIHMLREAGFPLTSEDDSSSRLQIGIKKLLSVIEMARQEPDNVAQRLAGALMGLGM